MPPALVSSGDKVYMESKNPNLGDDMERDDIVTDDITSETEHTTAGEQDTPDTPVDTTTPEFVSDDDTQPQDDAAAVTAAVAAEEASVEADDTDEDDTPAVTEAPVAAEDEADDTDEDDAPAVTEASVEAEDEADETGEDDAPAVAEAPVEDDASEAEEDDASESGDLDVDEDDVPAAVEDDDDFEDEDDEDEDDGDEADDSGPGIKRGDIVTGTVRETSPTEVLVNLGDDVIGVIASRELERMDRAALEQLQEGSEVIAFVLKVRGASGQPVLSLARAEEESNWRLAQEHFENKQVYFSKVAGYNKGGLIVRFGKVRGFVPASQISRERQQRASGDSPEERWGGMVGDDIAVKVVEIDRGRNRLILSERAAAREWRERQKSRLLQELAVGERRKGRVISLADFGAFVDLGGADGLVHLTELSWQHVTHPREIVQVGQEVEVEVISIDENRKRIGLSMKRLENDPWMAVVQQYDVGQLVQASVTKLTKFGAFARLVDAAEIEGLIHISELADYRVSHPREVVLVGDVLTLRIVKIDAERRRLGLSLRQVDSAKYMDQDWQFLDDDLE